MKARNILITGALLSLLNGHLNAQQKTYLKPFTFRGDLEYLMTAWSTGTTLNGNPPIIFGPVETVGNAAYHQDKLDSLFGTYFLGVNNIDRIIKEFKKTNPGLKEDKLREYIKDKIPSLESRGLFKRLFFDGKLTKEELESLEDGVYGYWYLAENDQASLPGILEIQYNSRKAERELLEEKVDTTKIIPGKKINEKEIEKEKPLTLEEEKRVKERLKYNFGVLGGFEYDSKSKFGPSATLRFYNIPSKKVNLGLNLSYGTREEGPTTNVISTNPDSLGFSGYGTNTFTNNIKTYDASLEAGYNLDDKFSLLGGLGISYDDILENLRVYESIRKNNVIVRADTDNYGSRKNKANLKYYAGLEHRINRFITNVGIGRKGNNTFYLARVGVRL